MKNYQIYRILYFMKIQDIQPIRNPKTGQWDYTGGDHSFSMWWALQCRNIIYI